MSSARPTILIAIAVVQRGKQFLIGQRPAGAALAGLWEFPGGKMVAGESAEAAAVRECWEETGLVVRTTFRYSDQVQEYEHGRVHLHFVHCELVEDGEPLPPWRWVKRGELGDYEFPAGNKALLEQLLDA